MFKLKTVVIISTLILSACGGGSTESSKYSTEAQLIEQYNLPPAPDAELAKTQMIDTNNNGIRDEVERAIVFRYKDEGSSVVSLVHDYAKHRQESMDSHSDVNALLSGADYSSLLVRCLVKKTDKDFRKVEKILGDVYFLVADTDTRKDKASQAEKKLSGTSFSSPSSSAVEEFCRKY